MAKNNLIYAPTVDNFNTTLNGAISDVATTITLNSVTGLQNKAGILVIDRVDTSGNLTPSKQEWVYFNGVSGSSVTLPSAVDGRGVGGSTAQSHSDGAIVEAVFDVTIWNGILTSYATQHLDAGTHTNFTTDILAAASTASLSGTLFVNKQTSLGQMANTSQASIYRANIGNQLIVPIGVSGASISGQLAIDAVQKNLLVGDGTTSNPIGFGAWTSFTPSWTNLTPGNGTNTGSYIQIGKLVFVKTHFVMGSTSSMGSSPNITLPITAASTILSASNSPLGIVNVLDSGIANYKGFVIYLSTTTASLIVGKTDGTYLQDAGITSAVPMSWGTNDSLDTYFSYEAA